MTDSPPESAVPKKAGVVVTDVPKFDLDSYITNYTGRTRYARLYLIGACSTVLAVDALKAAVAEAKAGNDVRRYEDAVKLLRRHLKPNDIDGVLDQAWMERKEKQMKVETDQKEAELKGYKNNLIKESIRMANEDLGTHYYQIGDLVNATKAYSRMRENCTTAGHIASTSFRIIQVAIEQGNWMSVQSNCHKIANLQMKQEESARYMPKVRVAGGLVLMHQTEYKEAAVSFLATDPSLTDTYNEVLTANDVAVYGGLCALASMTRQELQLKVLDNSSFRNFLELEPHIRRAISYFCASKYAQCLEILEAYRADYLLDLHLQRHVQNIYSKVRTKSIVQYFAPFSRVTLDAMSKTFASTNGKPIEDELISMIEKGILEARIDLEKRVLIARESNLREDTHRNAQEMIKSYVSEAHQKLLRMNVIAAGMEIKAAPKPKQNFPE